jgi:hypothetical protein
MVTLTVSSSGELRKQSLRRRQLRVVLWSDKHFSMFTGLQPEIVASHRDYRIEKKLPNAKSKCRSYVKSRHGERRS